MKLFSKKDQPISKIFRIAFVLFATTFGIGLYALIGAPITRLSASPSFDKIGRLINSANVALVNTLDLKSEEKNISDNITIKLSKPENFAQVLKTTIIDSAIKEGSTKIVKFEKDSKVVSIPELLYLASKIKPSDSLMRTISDSRYYINNEKDYKGTVVIPVLNRDIAYAAILEWEQNFLDITIPLTHPLSSPSEINMYKDLKIVTRQISGIDTRVILGANENVIYAWGIYNNNLIVASNKDDYSRIISALSN